MKRERVLYYSEDLGWILVDVDAGEQIDPISPKYLLFLKSNKKVR